MNKPKNQKEADRMLNVFIEKHDTLPSDFYKSKHKGKELMDTLPMGANLKLLVAYEIQCILRLKKERLIT